MLDKARELIQDAESLQEAAIQYLEDEIKGVKQDTAWIETIANHMSILLKEVLLFVQDEKEKPED